MLLRIGFKLTHLAGCITVGVAKIMTDSPETKGAVKSAAGYFTLVLVGSLVAAVLGGGFGAIIATVSPPFVTGLFSLQPEEGSVVRYAFSVGMIWGLFIGVAVSCFACLLAAIVKIIRFRIEHRSNPKDP